MKMQYSDRSHTLLNRVREDASSFRHNLKDLVRQTVKNDLPANAHTLLDHGRRRIDRGAAFASRQLQQLGQGARDHKTGVVAGAALLAIAAGLAAWLLRGSSQAKAAANSNSSNPLPDLMQ